jgi:hypothetical protein
LVCSSGIERFASRRSIRSYVAIGVTALRAAAPRRPRWRVFDPDASARRQLPGETIAVVFLLDYLWRIFNILSMPLSTSIITLRRQPSYAAMRKPHRAHALDVAERSAGVRRGVPTS